LDWIDQFLRATATIPSPEHFRLWAAITTLSAVLERRIFTLTRATRPAYPNLYVTLAGESGSGKTEAINVCRDLWAGLQDFHISPDNLTNAAFYDAMFESLRTFHANGHGASIYSALTVCSPELGVLIPKYDLEFLSDLSHIYDNQPDFKSKRRDKLRSVVVEKPTVNILAGVTPKALSEIMPEVAWGQGFASRMIFIFGKQEEEGYVDVFQRQNPLNLQPLRPRLESIWALSGEVEWSPDAIDAMLNWYNGERKETAPLHHRLHEYNTRRNIHLFKLTMISAVAAGRDLCVALPDFERARKWLYDAEAVMPDVFRAMGAKSDQQILRELNYVLWTRYVGSATNGSARKSIGEEEIWHFLSERVESFRIKPLVEAAVKIGILKNGGMPGTYIPRQLDVH